MSEEMGGRGVSSDCRTLKSFVLQITMGCFFGIYLRESGESLSIPTKIHGASEEAVSFGRHSPNSR